MKENSILETKDHPSYTAYLRSDGIVHLAMKDIEDYTVEILREQIQFLSEKSNGKKLPVMLTFSSYNSPNDETMKYASKDENMKYTKASAVVVDSLALRLGANFYLHFFKPKTPTKLFNTKEDAVLWLRKFV